MEEGALAMKFRKNGKEGTREPLKEESEKPQKSEKRSRTDSRWDSETFVLEALAGKTEG